MSWKEFKKLFNRSFWRAFNDGAIPISVPKTAADRERTVREVFDDIVSSRYAVSIPEAEIVMNKGHGIARTIPVFCIQDYIVYYFCIKKLEDVLCINRAKNTFGGWTLGGKIRKLEEVDVESDNDFYSGRFSFDPLAWKAAFGEFNSLLFAQLETGLYTHVLQFDLSNFYDCVRLDILERWIREESDATQGWIIALLFFLLNQWNRKYTGLHPQVVGIPQDALADCSRILANYYLQKYDVFAADLCGRADAEYFRYADDQMVLLKDPDLAERLMLLLTRRLDRFGLRVNQKKVYLWKTSLLLDYRCRDIQAIFAKPGDNQVKALVRKFAGAYLAIPVNKLKNTWNEGLPLLNRLIWAKLESLPKRQFEKLLIRYTARNYLMRADLRTLQRVAELNAKRSQPIDLSKKLMSLLDASDHNVFHMGILAYARSMKDKPLARRCKKRLKEIAQLMETNAVG